MSACQELLASKSHLLAKIFWQAVVNLLAEGTRQAAMLAWMVASEFTSDAAIQFKLGRRATE
ncbi:hypothetical protein PCASD_26582 [Puccinia coronata f. sp. avenae]|uniref:Uncharacterized protein n=1 Tax=Puccinia coronata f. sp. avenae TaxID=200324 RepID=A0A2N5TIE0_9BASI|nr:hypothetical protein PCASD_26582 [Puccinia coronata f. sp. avenae]